MSKRLFLLVLVLALTANVRASLYTCDAVDSEPRPDNTSKSMTVAFHAKSPYLIEKYKEPSFHQNKVPFLIYYAVDSTEPFMQYAVNFELAKLEANCRVSSNVNFVALTNSLYVNKNQIIVCKDRKFSYINLATFPEMNRSLIEKRKFISEGDHTGDDIGPLNYLVRYYPHTNKSFGKFPLAHPDFLHDLIEFVITKNELFPTEKYMPFLHLKSHGNSMALLSGLHRCQILAKILSQEKVIKAKINKEGVKLLSKLKSPSAVAKELDSYGKILDRLYLGASAGVGGDSSLGPINLGPINLGTINLGDDTNLGNTVAGLGAHEGLGADYAFGTFHVGANAVLRDLFDEDTGRTLGFIMFEACDTNRDPALHHKYIGNILGFYSASHSLWYRNLNWWTLLEKANNSTLNLLELLKEKTAEIQNIEVIKHGQ